MSIYPIPKFLAEDIIPYDPEDENDEISEPGFYFNMRDGYYEIWWSMDIFSDDSGAVFKMATTKYQEATDSLLMEAVGFWTGKGQGVLDLQTFH